MTTLRPYRADDAQPTWEVFHRAVHDTAAADYTSEQLDAWSPGQVDLDAWHARRSAAETFVAVDDDGRVVGFSDLVGDGLVDMLFVHPDAARRGVARMLIGAVVDRARDVGISELHTHASRTARPAFERFGFVVTRSNDTNMARGVVVPNFDMTLRL